MKRQATPRRLTYTAAFKSFDLIEDAKIDFDGTFAVFSRLLDADAEEAGSYMLTMERHLKADLETLDQAIKKARDVVLTPLHAIEYPNGPRGGVPYEVDGGSERQSPAISLVVNNGGGDDAA